MRPHLILIPGSRMAEAKARPAGSLARPAEREPVRDLIRLLHLGDGDLSPARLAAELFLLECD